MSNPRASLKHDKIEDLALKSRYTGANRDQSLPEWLYFSEDKPMTPTLLLVSVIGATLSMLPTRIAFAEETPPPATPSPCKYDWIGLEKAWGEYLMDANAKTAGAVVQGLHRSKEARENPHCEDRARVRSLFIQDIERLDKTIKMPGTRVPEIMQAMLAHMDAAFRQELEVRLGKTASTDPIGYAELIRKKYGSKTCPFIDVDPEKFNDVDPPLVALGKAKKSYQFRMKQMKRVLPARLQKAKNACIRVLEKVIRKTDKEIQKLSKK